MPANIESFVDARQVAWHGLGTVFGREMTRFEAMEEANLIGWNVRTEPLVTQFGEFSGNQVVIRNNPHDRTQIDQLAIVGDGYVTYQNESLFELGDDIRAASHEELGWETAGSLAGGRRVFGSLTLPDHIVIDPDGAADEIRGYLLVATSHDGSLAVTGVNTNVRVVCQNTLNMALKGAKNKFTFKHTKNVERRAIEARKALGLAIDYQKALGREAEGLYTQAVTDALFHDIVMAAFPKPEDDASKRSFTVWEKKVDLVYDLYRGKTCENIHGTAWGVFNALTERLDHYRGSRGDSDAGLEASAGFSDTLINQKNGLLSLVKEKVAA